MTAEQAGCYKPDPRLYRLALDVLGVAPQEAAFVAGSGRMPSKALAEEGLGDA
jgi:FMN phosphatase YigB (HAD superfamily)